MTQLRYLNLGSNNFSGTIPNSIGSLAQLRDLNLVYNSFYGTIPPEIGNLTNLERFQLGCLGRRVIENIDWLANLSHLQTLSMEGIFIAKANHWVDVFQTLQKLSSLTLNFEITSQFVINSHSCFNSDLFRVPPFVTLLIQCYQSSLITWLI
ncbi:putative non-specific serine/threonine protein kinase [Helianthus anomalus]